MNNENKNDRLTEKQAKCLAKWNSLNVPLHEGETVVQMVNHNPIYFLSSEGRVFSVARKEWHEMPQYTKPSKNCAYNNCSNKQLSVSLTVNSKSKLIRVSRLMTEYFPLSIFNPTNDKQVETHHIEPWDDEKGTDNNRLENLQRVGKQAHDVITMAQKGKMTLSGIMKHKNENLFFKKLAELSAGRVIIIFQIIDRETLEVKGTFGYIPTDEELERMFSGAALTEQAEAMKLIQNGEATGKVRIVNGVPQLIKEEKENEKNVE